MKPFSNMILLSLCLVVLSAGCADAPVKYEESKNKQQEFWKEQFDRHIHVLSPSEDDKIYVEFDGSFVLETFFKEKPPGYILEVADEFHLPNHHSTNFFQVERIDTSGVLLWYETQLDERSFGQRRILIDRGNIQLSWK